MQRVKQAHPTAKRPWQRPFPLSTSMSDRTLTILIIEESPVRAAILEEGMRESGYERIVHIGVMVNLPAKISAIDPDVIVIGLENPCRDTLEQMFQVSRSVRRPIAMFVDTSDSITIQAAVDAGVSAYVVDGLKKERVRPIMDVTISRFHAFSRLQEELAEAREALEARKVIERAKGILMKQKNMTEDEAYNLLRRTAMSQKRKLFDIAQSVVTAAQIFKQT
jgi:response regulator NasT